MTPTMPITDALPFGDMNGPLAYWGPVSASPGALLSPTEKDLLRQLRDRLAAAASTDLTDALTTLLAAPVGTAAA